MQRVMIIGQPGSGKSTLARALGTITHLPVFHIDHIHWRPNWVARPAAEKTALCQRVHARHQWIFEGGHSSTWPERLARADTLIWLDIPVMVRLWRVARRSVCGWGRSRPDLPHGCLEQLDPAFFRYIWRSRTTARAKCAQTFAHAGPDKARHHLRSSRDVKRYLRDLSHAVAIGNLGIPHR